MKQWRGISVSRSRVQAQNLHGVPLPGPVREYGTHYTLHSLHNAGSAIGSPPGQHECAFSPTSRTSHRIPRVTLRTSAAIYMYWRRLGPGSDSRRGTSRVGESVDQAPVTAGREPAGELLRTGRAGRAGEPRQLPVVIVFTAGNFIVAATQCCLAVGSSVSARSFRRGCVTERSER